MAESTRRFPRIAGIIGLIAAVLIVGIALGWLATPRKAANAPLPGSQERLSTAISTGRAFFAQNERPRPSDSSTNQVISPPPSSDTNLVADWETRLDEILGSDSDETQKAKQLLALFPRLPEEGQVEAAQHMSNLLPDVEYAPLGKYLADPKVPEAVLDVLIVDLLNRPNALKLPLLLEVARAPGHPKAAEAKDLMELYLEEDYGTDWNRWQAKMEQWIKDNPD